MIRQELWIPVGIWIVGLVYLAFVHPRVIVKMAQRRNRDTKGNNRKR